MSQEKESIIKFQQFKCAKPLDYSYRNLDSLEELNGNMIQRPLKIRGTPKKNRKSNRYKTSSFWLNNNNLKNVNGLRNLTNRLLDMADYLSWLNLSGNKLTVISDEFLLFPNLSMLYLHRNNIDDPVQAYKLRKSNKLRSLTLNDNPMCVTMGSQYRNTIVRLLPDLRKLDNMVILRSERESKRLPICKDIQVRLAGEYSKEFGENSKIDL